MNEGGMKELPDEIDDRLLEASRLAEDGDESAALELLLSLEPSHAENATLMCMIGVVAGHNGADGMAGDYFRRCLALEPIDPELLLRAGAGLAALDDPEAEAALRSAALLAPDRAEARMHYGAYLVRAGMVETGLIELDAARALDPDSAETRRALGIARLLTSRVPEALDELEEAVSLDAEDPELRFLYGLALIQDRDIARAAEEMYPLGESLATSGEVQAILSLLFAAAGWEEEAWVAFSRAEEAAEQLDQAVLSEIEDALAGDEEALRALLEDELAATALRERLYRA